MVLARDIVLWSFLGAALVLVVKNSKGFVADSNSVFSGLSNQTKILTGA